MPGRQKFIRSNQIATIESLTQSMSLTQLNPSHGYIGHERQLIERKDLIHPHHAQRRTTQRCDGVSGCLLFRLVVVTSVQPLISTAA